MLNQRAKFLLLSLAEKTIAKKVKFFANESEGPSGDLSGAPFSPVLVGPKTTLRLQLKALIVLH